jgi:hypothetical protein
MKQYFMTYGLRRAFFINTHCIASAAIIHLLNMSSQEEFLLGALKAAASLLDDIKILKEMHVAYPIVPVLLKAIRCLAVQWKINLPPDIREALETTDTPSPPVSYNTSRAIRPEGLVLAKNSAQTSVGASPSAVYKESTAAIEKEDYSAPDAYSTPDFLQMPPQPRRVGLGSPQPYLFTPFGPENLTGLPLRPPQDMPNAAFMGIDHNANNTNIRNNNIHLPVCNSAWDLSQVGFEMNTDDFFPSQWADWDQPEGSGGY